MILNLLKISVCICLIFLITHIKAENIVFSPIPVEKQLPAGQIYCTFQDSEGYIWYGTEEGLYRNDGYAIQRFLPNKSNYQYRGNTVKSIIEDNGKNIWIGTNRGVYILDKRTYRINPLDDEEIRGWTIDNMLKASDGSIWISTNNSILHYTSQGKRISMYDDIKWNGKRKKISYLYEDPSLHILWIVQWRGGIFFYDKKSDSFIPFKWPFKEHPASIIKDNTSPYYWITTLGKGIVRLDPSKPETEQRFSWQECTVDPQNHYQGEALLVYQDNIQNHLWVITSDNLYRYGITAEHTLYPITTPSLERGKKLLSTNIIQDKQGNIWISGYYPQHLIATYDKAPIGYNPLSVIKEKEKYPVTLSSIFYENNGFWIRLNRGKLCFYTPSDNKVSYSDISEQPLSYHIGKSYNPDGILCITQSRIIKHLQFRNSQIHEKQILDATPFLEDYEIIRTIHEDAEGNIWIGASRNLYCYVASKKIIQKIWENTGYINNIIVTQDKSIYATTETNGLLYLSPERKKYIYKIKESCTCITAGTNGDVWMGTQRGNVYHISSKTRTATLLPNLNGLDGNNIYQLETDVSGNLWIMTGKKIILYYPLQKIYKELHTTDSNIPLKNFACMFKDHQGNFYIGGTEGFITCNTQYIGLKNSERPLEVHPKITAIKVNGNLRFNNFNDKTIELDSEESDLELFLSTLDPLNSDKIHYAFRYKDEGYWTFLPQGLNDIYLKELPKGKHELEIKATDKNGYWSENHITVSIYRAPHWYETNLAYATYIIVVLFIGYYLIILYLKRQEEKNRIQMEEEIIQMKSRFFINVSHELRTPLTLIITPLNSLIKKVTDKDEKKELESIQKNAANLMEQVNQLLDFRRIEMNVETLNVNRGDLTQILYSIFDSFSPLAKEKDVTFKFECHIKELCINLDFKKVRKIVDNLLSNAFKYTEENGTITLSLDTEQHEGKEYAVIKVKDTGIGIPENEQEHIFERFHQVRKQRDVIGSGIGLNLVKEYTEMHQGHVKVESVCQQGTTFTVYLPADLPISREESYSGTDTPTDNDETTTIPEGMPEKNKNKKVLIVEDNNEFRNYMKRELGKSFTVYEAADGEEGEQIAIEKEPDIVITDLMMPKVDGIELCHRIKNNLKISHIPVIMLTASYSVENEKNSYKEGADAYISKPFDWDISLSRIQNILKQQKQRQENFQKDINATPESITISSADEKFLKKAISLVEENINNSEYSIEDMSHDMAMSRVNLFRKIRSTTGMSPTDFVKSIRLRKAAQLLSQGDMNIVEVAYSVGFNTPSYFTKSFKKMFGVLPTEYHSKQDVRNPGTKESKIK